MIKKRRKKERCRSIFDVLYRFNKGLKNKENLKENGAELIGALQLLILPEHANKYLSKNLKIKGKNWNNPKFNHNKKIWYQAVSTKTSTPPLGGVVG